jgi:hypothetical protein
MSERGGRSRPWLVILGLAWAVGAAWPQAALPGESARMMVADFNRSGWQTNLGDPFGAWDRDPEDRTQFCRARLVEEPRVGDSGFSLMLDYDVQSPNPAFNGFWMKLPNIPVREFSTLSFAIKGDPERGFTRRVKLELKGKRRSASYLLDGIEADWVRLRIPLAAFEDIEKIRTASEFVLVFDDQVVTQPVGAIYLDEVAFESTR